MSNIIQFKDAVKRRAARSLKSAADTRLFLLAEKDEHMFIMKVMMEEMESKEFGKKDWEHQQDIRDSFKKASDHMKLINSAVKLFDKIIDAADEVMQTGDMEKNARLQRLIRRVSVLTKAIDKRTENRFEPSDKYAAQLRGKAKSIRGKSRKTKERPPKWKWVRIDNLHWAGQMLNNKSNIIWVTYYIFDHAAKKAFRDRGVKVDNGWVWRWIPQNKFKDGHKDLKACLRSAEKYARPHIGPPENPAGFWSSEEYRAF